MENAPTADPYEAVLADLRAKRQQIDNTIALLEGLRSGGGNPVSHGGGAPAESARQPGNRPDLGPGAFLGMTIPDAVRKLLATERRQMQTSEIVVQLERGGLVLTSADKVNTVGSVLLRRFNTVGDVVRVSRGLWGLQEWYPGRRFPGSKGKPDDPKAEEQEEPAVGNESDPLPDRPTAAPAGWPQFITKHGDLA
jgi:hypothetical protein